MIKTLQMEILKLKRTNIALMATIIPLFAVFQGAMFVSSNNGQLDFDLWNTLFIGSMSQFSSLIFPITITVIIAMITRVEHSGNGWKQLLTMPVKREDVYFLKLIIGIFTIIYSVFIFCIGMITIGIWFGGNDSIPIHLMVVRPFIALIASMPVIAMQFYLSFRFSHIGIPLAFGAGLSLPSMLIANSTKYWIYYPWTYPIVSTMTETFGVGEKGWIMYSICFVSFVIIISAGLLRFRTKDIL